MKTGSHLLSLAVLLAMTGCEVDSRVAPTPVPEPQADALGRTWMVAVSAPSDLDALAATHGLEIVRAPGRSGYALVRYPELGDDIGTRKVRLARDPMVLDAFQPALIEGSGKTTKTAKTTTLSATAESTTTTTADTTTTTTETTTTVTAPPTLREQGLLWHLDAVEAPSARPGAVVVAVLDTGVAYAAAEEGGVLHAAAPGLASSPIVAPWDFVDGDALPLDQHFHGTHIASIIASTGEAAGVAPGASLMPLRILDASNRGNEYSLIEALYWAADNGADVINMSLSFPIGYRPSRPLLDAIQYAHDQGAVMVAASGNHHAHDASWPAASPLVIGVGATRPGAWGQEAAPYGNTSLALDVVAPGGDLTRDKNGDGYPDGILAESIYPGDPTRTGLWFASGTSQASAVVSGLAAHLLAEGVSADDVHARLFDGATSPLALLGATLRGLGGGLASYSGATGSGAADEAWSVGILPYLATQVGYDGTEQILPRVHVVVVDEQGDPAPEGLIVGGRVWSSDGATLAWCTVDAYGHCELGENGFWAWTPRYQDGVEQPLAWAFTVDGVIADGVVQRPGQVIFASDALELLLAALSPEDRDLPLLISWSDGTDPLLGDVAAAWSVVDEGSGLATSPLGLVATRSALTLSSTSFDVDLDGSGLATSPLGLRSTSIYSGTLGGADSSLLDLSGQAVSLSTGVALYDPEALDGTEIAARASGGGWTGDLGGATALLVSGVVPLVDPEASASSLAEAPVAFLP